MRENHFKNYTKQKKKPPVFTGGFIGSISTDIKIRVS